MEFDHPDYKGSSLFMRSNRMWNKINLIETKTDLKLILKIYQINNYLILKGIKRVTRDGDNYLQNSLHFLESATKCKLNARFVQEQCSMAWISPYTIHFTS